METKVKVLNQLIKIIKEKKNYSSDLSYTAKLFSKGKVKIANKVGEEAIEVISAFLSQEKKDVAEETADLIFHLFVLLEYAGISPEEVWKVLQKRMKVRNTIQ
ncbi:MAG: phosphoribosyl-ATP diphosphatase [Rickettsiales bacterium]|nr:phosphoribosyl-ATP diphosphatase [Rickettsiales bacterium]|tara:strand:+ start:336 stop:644 length:309 start_codon:yes stop_codon:yes gene_type:complete